VPEPFRVSVWLDELYDHSFEEALDIARATGAPYVWFTRVPGRAPWVTFTDAEMDALMKQINEYGLQPYLLCAESPFHDPLLCDIDPLHPANHESFQRDREALRRSMEVAARFGISATLAYSFRWPGEDGAGYGSWPWSPTWAMRWATRGGILGWVDLNKLESIFGELLEYAERFGVDLVVGMRAFHLFASAENFVRVAERLGSPRFRVMWSPGDTRLSSASTDAHAEVKLLDPYLHGLHLKDITVTDGPGGEYAWRPIGEGEIGYADVFEALSLRGKTVHLGVATHFLLESGGTAAAMRYNVRCVTDVLDRATHKRSTQRPEK